MHLILSMTNYLLGVKQQSLTHSLNHSMWCLLCGFTFLVPYCCDVRYDFRITTMFDSAVHLVVSSMAHVLFTLFVFV